jgi:FeS assembly protein IscX
MNHYEPPIQWADHEDVAIALYEKFGDDFTEAKIYRIRFTELIEWVLTLPTLRVPASRPTRATSSRFRPSGCMSGVTTNKLAKPHGRACV